MKFALLRFGLVMPIVLLACSCKNIMFKTFPEGIKSQTFLDSAFIKPSNYTIQPFDFISVALFTNKGERAIDPNFEFEMGKGMMGGGQQMMGGQTGMQPNNKIPEKYMVNERGLSNLPMVGLVKLEGLKLYQADSLLSVLYSKYFTEPFIVTKYLNKRVFLMGAMGEQVFPLENENTTLIELLSKVGDVTNKAKIDNVRLMRGDLRNPAVQVVDLSTVSGMRSANLLLQPNDVVYLEPRRRFDREAVADFNFIISSISSVFTIVFLVYQLQANRKDSGQ